MFRRSVFFLLLVIVSIGYSQELPSDYKIGNQTLRKISDSTPASNSIERILIQGTTIWLGTSDGLSKSTDNGTNWTNYYKTAAFGEENISALGYDNGIIWAATWHMENILGSNVPTGTGLRFSSDAGATWVKIPQPIDDPGDSSIVFGINKIRALPVTVPQQNFIYDLAFTKNTIWIATFAAGIRKSTDMGQTWKRIILPPDNLNSIKPTDTLKFSLQPQSGRFGPEAHLNHIGFSILALDDNTLYAGTAGGINKSTDGGVSWTKFTFANQTKHITGNQAFVLDRNEFDNSIWAATFKTNNVAEYWGVSVSRDGGESWENYLNGEKVRDFGFKYFGNPGAYTGADVFAASENGLFRTSNNGATWISSPTMVDNTTKIPVNTNKFLSVESQRLNDGSNNIWIGSSGEGLIRLKEDSNGFWSGDWKVYLSREKVTSPAETYAFPNPFSPDAEVTKIVYSTSQNESVTIRIFDFGMNLVKTLLQNASRGISDEHVVNWDGRNESGKIVPNGVYFYRIDIGSGTPLFGKIMVMM